MVASWTATLIFFLRALFSVHFSRYGGRMQSRRGCEEETEETHETDYQNMASLRGFPGVLW